MISDNERREIAHKLRTELWHMKLKKEWYEEERDLDKCGNRAYRNIAGSVAESDNCINIVERLADLIDRPSGIATEESDGYGKCHTCGASFIVSVPAAFRCEEESKANYCPCCGTPLEWR